MSCGVVRSGGRGPNAEPQVLPRTIRDLGAELVWTDYYWHDEDGFQMSVWRDADQPTHVWINFAGSIPAPTGPDITTLWQNVWDENSVASSYPRFILQALQDLETNYLNDGDILYFSGHSQGGNVAQMVAFALATFFRYPTTFENTDFTPSYLPQWPNVAPNTYQALSNRLYCRNIGIGGGAAYAARPMHYWARVNELMAGEGQAFTLVAAIDDVVPQLGVAATWFDDPNRVTVWHRLRATYRNATIGGALLGRPGFLVADLLPDILPNLVAVSAVTPAWVPNTAYISPRVRTIADRAQVLFEDDVRPDGFNVHGNAYIDPNVTGELGRPVPPSLDGLRIGSELWGPWLNDRLTRPLRGVDDVCAVDLADGTARNIPVIRNDLVEAAAWETARIRSVRVDGWHSKNCLERAFDVSVSSDGREIVLAPPNAATVLAACTSSDGDVNDRDLTIEYELEDGTRARLFVDVHHSGWGPSTGPGWLNEATSPWTDGPYFWAPPALTPTVIPSRAPLTSFAPQHRRTVRDSTPVGAEMNLIFVAGYGVDCYGGRALERAATIPGTDTRLCNDDRTRNEAALGDARRAYDGMAPALQALECQDGIPDTMWTNIQSETSGDRDHPNAGLYSALTAFRASYVGMNPWDVVASVGRHPWLNRFWFTCGATSGVSWTCPDNGDGTIDYGALEALHAAFRDRDARNVVVEVPGASGGSCAPLVRAPLYLPCSMTGGAPYLGRPAGGAVDVNVTGGLLGGRMWLYHVSYTVIGMLDRGLLDPGDSDGTGTFYSSGIEGVAVDACASAMAAGPFGGRSIGTPVIAFPDRVVPPDEVASAGLPSGTTWCVDELVLKFSTSMFRCNPSRLEGTNYIAFWPDF